MVFVEVRCADYHPVAGTPNGRTGQLPQTHYISDLWLYVAISLTAAELILRYGKAKRPRFAAVASA